MLTDFEAPAFSMELAKSSKESLYQSNSLPKLMMTVLRGGKDAGSKVKFTRFYLIFDCAPLDFIEVDEG